MSTLNTARDNNTNGNGNENEQGEQVNLANLPSVRNILGFIEKYERFEVQELLSQMNCNWLLSFEDFKMPIEHPVGLFSQMIPINEDHIIVMMPCDPEESALDYREIHQIIRELTIGIFVLNQQPSLQLLANFDESTQCQMPAAYIDTKLGQTMIQLDYLLKSLWHGATFDKNKRVKFCERWRTILDVDSTGVSRTKKSIFDEFLNAGLEDIASDPDYAGIYEENISNSSLKG
jgi:hypothetical protein